MNAEEKLYRDLQIHLDKQTIGFPSSESGSDILLLKQLFPPDEAEMAMLLTYEFEDLEQIHKRGEKIGKSLEEIEHVLDKTAKRGIIGYREKNDVKQYKNIPYIVGMIEGAVRNPTPELIEAHNAFLSDGAFLKDFVSTKVPQMRTIPIEKSIAVEHYVGSYDKVKEIIETTKEPIAIVECVCRRGAESRGEPCKQTARKDTCMAFRYWAKNAIDSGHAREVSKEEALNIIRQNEEENLVLQPSNAQDPEFICSCCGCCCGILRMHKAFPNPVDFWATNFYAEVNPELCTGCGTCEESCQTGAMKLDEEEGISAVDLTRCLGCGLCVASCPDDAIELKKKGMEVIPPRSEEDMFEVIMSGRA